MDKQGGIMTPRKLVIYRESNIQTLRALPGVSNGQIYFAILISG